MRVNSLILDGDMLGINPNHTTKEVFDKISERFGRSRMFLYLSSVQIKCGEHLLWFKDREFGRCDFRAGPMPPNEPRGY